MDLLRELKAMPVTLHLLQVGPRVPRPPAPRHLAELPAPHPSPWLARILASEETVPCLSLLLHETGRGIQGQSTVFLAEVPAHGAVTVGGGGIHLPSLVPSLPCGSHRGSVGRV